MLDLICCIDLPIGPSFARPDRNKTHLNNLATKMGRFNSELMILKKDLIEILLKL